MSDTAYYNEIESYPALWLRNLIEAGHIAPGMVDQRDIREVQPDDITATQAHFFAGIGVWSYALRLAGWPSNRPVWTGSCPCQPFSSAGKRGGTDDPRHLWPEWFRLIRECRPPVIFGEQVASKDGLAWLDLVYADLESEGYAVAAVDLCAASVGAPHIRQRLYFVADANPGLGEREEEKVRAGRSVAELYGGNDRLADTHRPGTARLREHSRQVSKKEWLWNGSGRSSGDDRLGDASIDGGRAQYGQSGEGRGQQEQAGRSSIPDNLGDTSSQGLPLCQCEELPGAQQQHEGKAAEQSGGAWSDIEWLQCTDGKARPTKPGLFPLAHGAAGRVGKLRAYGNAIVAPLAAEFIRVYMECTAGARTQMVMPL